MSIKNLMECPICLLEYNTTCNIPMVNGCGHTCCNICISKIDECSLCKRLISSPVKNYAYCDIVERVEDQIFQINQNNITTIKFSFNWKKLLIGSSIILGVGILVYKGHSYLRSEDKDHLKEVANDTIEIGLMSKNDMIMNAMQTFV